VSKAEKSNRQRSKDWSHRILAHIAKDMWMVLGWQRTHAHEFLGTDFDDLNA
jgi:hypothetical protein